MRRPFGSPELRRLCGLLLIMSLLSSGCDLSVVNESGKTNFRDGYPEHGAMAGSDVELRGEFVSKHKVQILANQEARKKEWREALESKNYVMILIDKLPKGGFEYVSEEVGKYPQERDGYRGAWSNNSDKARLTLFGASDVQGVVDSIEFGEVTEIDEAQRKIFVKFDASVLPEDWLLSQQIKNWNRHTGSDEVKALLASAENPNDPKYFDANLKFLKYGDWTIREDVLERFMEIDPESIDDEQLRQEISDALMALARSDDTDPSSRRLAVYIMVPWSQEECVPLLIELVEDHSPFIKKNVLQAIAELRDPRTFEPVVKLVAESLGDREDAKKCLLVIGSPAEESVLNHIDQGDVFAKRALIEVLGEIGSKKSLTKLESIRDQSEFRGQERTIDDAIAAIRSRSGN